MQGSQKNEFGFDKMQLRMSFLKNVSLLDILEARFGPILTKKIVWFVADIFAVS